MATSGSFRGTTSNALIVPFIVWRATQSVSGNYSDITATLTYSRTNEGYVTSGTWSGALIINGVSFSATKYLQITHDGSPVAVTASQRVYHDASGEKTVTISASGAIPGTSLSSTSISQTISLDTIPRGATITSAADFTDEGIPSLTVGNPAGSAAKLFLSLTFDDGTVICPEYSIPPTSGSVSIALSEEQRASIRNHMASVTTARIRYVLRTNLGEDFYSYASKTVNIVNAEPQISVNFGDFQTGDYVFSGFTQLGYTITATPRKGASVSYYRIQNGDVISAVRESSGTLAATNNGDFVFTVIDSRGNTGSYTASFHAVPYVIPSITAYGSMNGNGKVTISYSGIVYTGEISESGGKNATDIWLNYQINGGERVSLALAPDFDGNKFSGSVTVDAGSYKNSVEASISIDDDFTGAEAELIIQADPVFYWGKNDFFLRLPVQHPEGKAIQLIPYYTTSDIPNTSASESSFFRGLISKLCADFPSRESCTFVGAVNSGVTAFCLVTIEDTNDLNGGLPKSCGGIALPAISGKAIMRFGTDNYAWSFIE